MHRTNRLRRRLTVGGLAGALAILGAVPAAATDHEGPNLVDEPASFTSMWSLNAAADQVVGGGEPGATGRFDLRLDAATDTICFDIVLDGVTPPYDSPANTATHIHEAPAGEAGPPRVVFPDPVMNDDGTLSSSGCVASPFMTGVGPDDGGDHGDGFTVAELEADPTAYYVDTHTTDFMAGAVRGQFTTMPVPMGGMDTGDGSVTAAADTPARLAGIVGGGLLVLLVGLGLARRDHPDAETA